MEVALRNDLLPILQQLQSERHVDRHVLVEAVRSAIESAARKSFSHPGELTIEIDEETFEIRATEIKEVTDHASDSRLQVSLEDAVKIKRDAQLGDRIQVPTTLHGFGRIATQTARQVIIQRIRDAEREQLYDEMKQREGELVTCTVKRVQRGNVIVELGRAEGILPYREQSPRENYAPGNRIRAYILSVDKSSRGPQIVLSRSSPEFVRGLFESEVPELHDGTIEIKAIAREAGNRTKIAVVSHDANVDPVGACVGMKGTRVRSIVDELSGEKIDIVRWSTDPVELVRNALSPAEITSIAVEKETGIVKAVVPRGQLSLAIGKKGQNARLASKLTRLQIDISTAEGPEGSTATTEPAEVEQKEHETVVPETDDDSSIGRNVGEEQSEVGDESRSAEAGHEDSVSGGADEGVETVVEGAVNDLDKADEDAAPPET